MAGRHCLHPDGSSASERTNSNDDIDVCCTVLRTQPRTPNLIITPAVGSSTTTSSAYIQDGRSDTGNACYCCDRPSTVYRHTHTTRNYGMCVPVWIECYLPPPFVVGTSAAPAPAACVVSSACPNILNKDA